MKTKINQFSESRKIPKNIKVISWIMIFFGIITLLIYFIMSLINFDSESILALLAIMLSPLLSIFLGLKLLCGKNWARIIILIFSWILLIGLLVVIPDMDFNLIFISLYGIFVIGMSILELLFVIIVIYYLQFNETNKAFFKQDKDKI